MQKTRIPLIYQGDPGFSSWPDFDPAFFSARSSHCLYYPFICLPAGNNGLTLEHLITLTELRGITATGPSGFPETGWPCSYTVYPQRKSAALLLLFFPDAQHPFAVYAGSIHLVILVIAVSVRSVNDCHMVGVRSAVKGDQAVLIRFSQGAGSI